MMRHYIGQIEFIRALLEWHQEQSFYKDTHPA
jgi:hypothetical protein